MTFQLRLAHYMPLTDFKQEPTAARLKRIWLENRGNWLVLTGVIVSLLAWAIGYFDLIPEITAVRRQQSPPALLASGRSLIVHVVGCASDEGQVVAMLYDAEHFTTDSVPIRVEGLKIQDREAVWPVHNIRFGSYVVLAFHDVDGDEQFDPGTERQGISHPATTDGLLQAEGELSPGLEAAFQFDRDKQEITVELKS